MSAVVAAVGGAAVAAAAGVSIVVAAAGVSVVVAAAALALALALWLERRAARERVARACHELRGPLSAAHLALHGAARRAEVAPGVVAGLELELRRASLAVDDLQGCARRADAQADVDLDALLACQVGTWREVAQAHGAEVVLRGGGDAGLVRGDAVRLAQALGNVVANAIEHGGGRIEVRVWPAGRSVRVEVADGGAGLPAPVADLVRRPGAGRGERGRGLAIASGIAAGHGGRLLAQPSARGAGLALELPLAAAAVAAPGVAP
jgi:signal transduction histidine kinase